MINFNNVSSSLQHQSHRSDGITLVALVVTIVVLLILAGITITLLFSENGIITKAQRAKEETDKAQANELDMLNNLPNQINSILNGLGSSGGGDVEDIDIEKLSSYQPPEPEVDYSINNGDSVACIKDYDEYTTLEAAIEDSLDGDIIYLMSNYILTEDITVPNNVTLVIPTSDAYNDVATGNNVTGGEYASSQAYRTLKVPEEITLTVNGTLLVAANQRAGAGGGQGVVTGNYGQMVVDGDLIVNGSLYARGYITGTGTVIANNTSTVYQLWQDLSHMQEDNLTPSSNNYSNNVLNPSNYYVQNIMTETYYMSGSSLRAQYFYYEDDKALSGGLFLIGGGLFQLDSENSGDYIKTTYDWRYDKFIYEINGSVTACNVNFWPFPFSAYLMKTIGNFNMDMNGLIIPINGNIVIKIPDGGSLNITNQMKLLPGSGIIVEDGGSLSVASGGALYLYDYGEDAFQPAYAFVGDTELFSGSWRRTIYGKIMGSKSGGTMDGTSPAKLIVNSEGTLSFGGDLRYHCCK